MKRLFAGIICLLLGLLNACSGDDVEIDPSIEPEPDLPTRTILYYLGADNSLYTESKDKIEALRLGFPGGKDHLVIYKDSRNESPELLEVYAAENGENQIRVIKTYPEQNSATGETFQRVLADVKTSFRADSYGMILFSHASGWLPKGTLTRPESAILQMGTTPIRTYTVAMDGSDELDLVEFAAAIPDHFFDFIAFEACFMAGIEVLYELKDKTDYVISSAAEIVSPGFLPIYPEALPMLYQSQPDLAGFAKAYFDFWNAQTGDYRSATITVTRTAGLSMLANWVKLNTGNQVSEKDLFDIQHFDRYRNHRLFFDFADYHGRKTDDVGRNQLASLLNTLVVYKAATPSFIPGQLGFQINYHSGITTYIPQERFPSLNERYKDLTWYKLN